MSSSERACAALLLGLLVALCGGCVENGLRQAKTPFDYAPLPQPELPPPAAGAIWRGDSPSGSFLFFDQKARGVGDQVTIIVQESVQAEGAASTETTREGVLNASVSSDIGFAGFVQKAFSKLFSLFGVNSSPTLAPGETVNAVQSSTTNDFAGDGSTRRSGSFTAVVTCRVVAVLPNDVFHVRGRRALLVNHEEQFITIEGLLRQEDISINNTASSASLAEARLTLDGIGVVDDKQRPGWLARILDWVYPL